MPCSGGDKIIKWNKNIFRTYTYWQNAVFRWQDGEGIPEFPEDVEVSTPGYQGEGLPHAHGDQVAGGQDEVDDVEGGQHYHHEQHAVDREVPMKISEKFVILMSIQY